MAHPPRPPSFDHGVISALWAVALGFFIWAFMIAGGVSNGLSVIVAALATFFIFLFVRLRGEDEPKRPPRRNPE